MQQSICSQYRNALWHHFSFISFFSASQWIDSMKSCLPVLPCQWVTIFSCSYHPPSWGRWENYKKMLIWVFWQSLHILGSCICCILNQDVLYFEKRETTLPYQKVFFLQYIDCFVKISCCRNSINKKLLELLSKTFFININEFQNFVN